MPLSLSPVPTHQSDSPQLYPGLPATGQLPLGLAPTGDFDAVRERVHQDDADKWDALTLRRDIRLHQGRLWFPEAAQSDFAAFLKPTIWATSQFCQRLGMPTGYFKRCPHDLQDTQFNHWIQTLDVQTAKVETAVAGMEGGDKLPSEQGSAEPGAAEQWLLRAKGDTLRGVLSERYARMDNGHLLESLASLLPPSFRVDWFHLSDESLHLRLVDTKSLRRILPGDDLMVGLHLGNSEVGRRAVTVDALVYRLICTNGMIRLHKGKSLLHQRHVFLSTPRFQATLQEAIGQALEKATEFLDLLHGATRLHIADVPAALETLGQQWGLSQGFLERAESSLRSEPSFQQETLWGLVNGLTQAAHGLSADDRYTVETLAGRLIEQGLPKISTPRPVMLNAADMLETAALSSQNGLRLPNGAMPLVGSAVLGREAAHAQ